MPLPVSSHNSNSQNWNVVNNVFRQIEREQVTKTFRQSGGNSIIQGKLPSDTYGIEMFDSENNARILLGFAPDDGRPGLWITIDDKDVIDELNA